MKSNPYRKMKPNNAFCVCKKRSRDGQLSLLYSKWFQYYNSFTFYLCKVLMLIVGHDYDALDKLELIT